MSKFQPRGIRGSWFAEYDGQLYPCIHKHWRCGEHKQWHDDPFARPGIPKWNSLIEAIRWDCVVIETADIVPTDILFGSFQRTGYLGLLRIENFELLPNENSEGCFHMRFKFAERLA